jgi:PadR family transcriptional regulator, regulatory protein PadR
MNGQVLKGHLDLLLLAAVGTRPAHGYAIVEQLRERSGGTFDLAEGTVYPALHRLEQAGLLRSGWSMAAGRRRRVYELTARGRGALEVQQRDWRRFSSAVSAVLGSTA